MVNPGESHARGTGRGAPAGRKTGWVWVEVHGGAPGQAVRGSPWANPVSPATHGWDTECVMGVAAALLGPSPPILQAICRD